MCLNGPARKVEHLVEIELKLKIRRKLETQSDIESEIGSKANLNVSLNAKSMDWIYIIESLSDVRIESPDAAKISLQTTSKSEPKLETKIGSNM